MEIKIKYKNLLNKIYIFHNRKKKIITFLVIMILIAFGYIDFICNKKIKDNNIIINQLAILYFCLFYLFRRRIILKAYNQQERFIYPLIKRILGLKANYPKNIERDDFLVTAIYILVFLYFLISIISNCI